MTSRGAFRALRSVGTRVPAPALALSLVLSLALASGALAHPPEDEVLADLEARMAAEPADPVPYLERAIVRSERGRAEAALRDCAEARKRLSPGHPARAAADWTEARVLLAAGRTEEGLALLDRHLRERPDHAAARLARARALRRAGRGEEAVAEYRQTLAVAPSAGPDPALELATVLRSSGRPAAALEALRAARRRLGPVPAIDAAGRALAAELRRPWERSAGTADEAPPVAAPAETPDRLATPSHPGAPRTVRGPYLQLATAESVVVRWRTDSPAHRRVRFGPAGAPLDRIAGDGALAVEHEVTLGGLEPGTRYAYAVEGGGEPAGTEPVFRTPPAPGDDAEVRIWVVGDSGTADAAARAVRDAYRGLSAVEEPADLWLMLGDNAYPSGTDLQYQAAVFDAYPDELSSIPLWSALGNHDAASADPDTGTGVYFDLFTLPRSGEAGGVPSGTEAYYSFDHGPIHFVCLDSHGSDRSPDGAMLTWLRADLEATEAPWVVAFWHHPPYSKGSHDSDRELRLVEMRERFLPVLEEHGVDLVLAGHSHSYERSALLDRHYGTSDTLAPGMLLDGGDGRPADEGGDGAYEKATVDGGHEGAVYAVAGSSGRLGGGALDHPAMVVGLRELGSLVLDVRGRELQGRFLRDDGTVGDTFVVLQGPPPPPAPPVAEPALPGFRLTVSIDGGPGGARIGVPEDLCLPETACFSGAVPGRTEVLVRVPGPKPNGYLWPTLVKLTTSGVEVWIEQIATGELRYYSLPGTTPGGQTLPGRFDRRGFLP